MTLMNGVLWLGFFVGDDMAWAISYLRVRAESDDLFSGIYGKCVSGSINCTKVNLFRFIGLLSKTKNTWKFNNKIY